MVSMAASASRPHPSSFYHLIGRNVVERYGRFRGRVVSYKVTSDGELDKVFISNDGFIMYKTPSSLILDGKVVMIVPPPIKRAREVLDELEYIYLQMKTLNNIFSIDSRWAYVEKYYRMFRTRFESLLKEVNRVLRSLENRRRRLNELIAEYKEGLFTLQLAQESGRVDPNIYKACYAEVSEEILRLSNELEEVENIISDISTSQNQILEIMNSIEERLKEVEGYEVEEV